jgi:hypothetical protein
MKKYFFPQILLVFVLVGFISSCKKSSPDGNNGNNNGSNNGSDCTNTDSLYVRISVNSVVKNGFDRVLITVFDCTGADITNSCNIKANNTYSVTSNYLPTLAPGTYTITATHKFCTAPSTSVTLQVIPSPYKKKIIVEDCTGAWCGFCPRLSDKLEKYKSTHPDCIVTAVHGGGGDDIMKFQYYNSYNAQFGVGGYPTVIINRKKYNLSYDWNEQTSVLDNALKEPAPLGISISSHLNGSNVEGTVKVKFGVTTTSTMKLVINYIENGIIYPQVNYYSSQYGYTPYLYGGISPINNFSHNGVLRRTATSLFGDLIPTSIVTDGIYELPFTIPISGSTSGGTYTSVPTNSAIVAFVVDGASGSPAGIYNVQYAPVGQTVNANFNE